MTKYAVIRGLAATFLIAVAPCLLVYALVPREIDNSPLNDEWAFGRGAFRFIRGEGIHYQNGASMPLIGQWLWSFPFVKSLGESYLSLRLSTLLLSALGLLAFFDLMHQETSRPGLSVFATACLAWNPWYFMLAGTYQSDVPALAASLLALAGYVRAKRRDDARWLWPGAAAALTAAAIRQNTIAAPLAAAVMFLIPPRSRWRWQIATVIPALVGVLLHFWLKSRADVYPYPAHVPDFGRWLWLMFVGGHYMGLAALPMLILMPPAWPDRRFFAALAFMATAALFQAWIEYDSTSGGIFPYMDRIGSLVTPWGAINALPDQPETLGWKVRLLITLLGCLSAAELFRRLFSPPRTFLDQPLLVFTLLQAAILTLPPWYYDRYFLFLFPGALTIASRGRRPVYWKFGMATLIGVLVISCALMHDWLEICAARWTLGRRAVAAGANPRSIAGGLNWMYYWQSDLNVRYRYRMSFAAPPMHRVAGVQPCSIWMAPGTWKIYLLEIEDTS